MGAALSDERAGAQSGCALFCRCVAGCPLCPACGGVCVCVSETASGLQGASQPPGFSPLGAASSVEPARGLKEGPVPDLGFDPVLGRSISVARAPSAPRASRAVSWWARGSGAGCCTEETLSRTSRGLGYRLHRYNGCWQGRAAPGSPHPQLRTKKREPCRTRASQAGSASPPHPPPPDPSHGERGVPCTRQGLKKPADSGAWVGPEDALQSPLRGPVSPLPGEGSLNYPDTGGASERRWSSLPQRDLPGTEGLLCSG